MSMRRLIISVAFCICVTMCAELYALDQPLDYSLRVLIDPASSTVKGEGQIQLRAGDTIRLTWGALNIRSMRLDRKRLPTYSRGQRGMRISTSRKGTLRFTYDGTFKPHGPQKGEAEAANLISSNAVSLVDRWYPGVDRLCLYHLSVTLPNGFEAISEADGIEKISTGALTVFTYRFPYQIEKITLVGSDRYKILKDRVSGIDIFAYVFPEDMQFARTYIDRTKSYLQMYGKLISAYPYKRFSIVENVLPTGYSFPTYTLLGKDVIRLPFIPETSLGHEILHQWFGNLVYIDYTKGNWAEGLTTYLADHLFEEQKHRGPAYRKGLLIDYQSYVNEGNEFSLAEFRSRTDYASKAIGYGKGAMVFHMLRMHVGDEAFMQSLRHLIKAHPHKNVSWTEIRKAFERSSRKDLAWFFQQWVYEKGLPRLSLEDSKVTRKDGSWEVRTTVVQWEKPYALEALLTLGSADPRERRPFQVDARRKPIAISSVSAPDTISLDKAYDVARRLTTREFPPVIARLLGSEEILVVPTAGLHVGYARTIEFFKLRGAIVKETPSEADMRRASLVLLGTDNPLVKQFFGPLKTEGGFSVSVREHPLNPLRVAAIIHTASEEESDLAFFKMLHYGRYSTLAFDKGTNIMKSVDETESGIRSKPMPLPRLDVQTLNRLLEIVGKLGQTKIVYVGESHDQFSHHLVELEIIKELHRQEQPIAIGMEMFQKPTQPALDRYLSGEIDEKEFLKQSQYFTRWGFDYKLYKPILDFARAHGIPVVALNVDREIEDKAYRLGLDSLSPEEKAHIPAQLDYSDKAYEARLRKVFEKHESAHSIPFERFHQAQVLWDETMAESVSEFLKKHPEYRMIVLAGVGHLAYGSGIPRRVARRAPFRHAIILNDVEMEKGIADYVLSPQPVDYTPAPKLMVFLLETHGRVTIQGFSENSISEKAGLKSGDVILQIDGTAIHAVDDVRAELLYHKKGDHLAIKVARKDVPDKEQEKEFILELQ